MKANELMIFDIVRRKKDNRTMIVVEVGYDENIGAITTDDRFYGDFEDYHETQVEPIPITPEILEKNGFVQNPRSKSRRSYQICNSDVYISWWRGRLNILFKPFIGHSTNHVNVDGKYVHELQHALRICGIEKEIVL